MLPSDFSYTRHMPNNLYHLDPGPRSPEIVRMIVEIPKNSSNKYECDGKLGVFRLDRKSNTDNSSSAASRNRTVYGADIFGFCFLPFEF